MANVDRANGFRPSKSLVGAPWTSLVRSYPALDTGRTQTEAGNIYIGSVVNLTSSGDVKPAATTEAVLGVVVAVGTKNSETALNTDNVKKYFDPDNLSKRYLKFDEAGYVGVVPADVCLFSVQSSEADKTQGSTGAFGANTGSVTTGNSAVVIGAGNDVTVIEQEERPDNDTSAVNGRYIVKFNNISHTTV